MSHGYPLQGADPLSGRSGHERRACTQGRHAVYVGGRARPAGNSQRAIDATLMILALRNVTCVADWMADVAQGDDVGVIDKALDEFRRQLPDLVPARDTLEHFDEYAVGQGRLQKKAPFPFAFSLSPEGSPPKVQVGPFSIDVAQARNACRRWAVTLLAQMDVDSEREHGGRYDSWHAMP